MTARKIIEADNTQGKRSWQAAQIILDIFSTLPYLPLDFFEGKQQLFLRRGYEKTVGVDGVGGRCRFIFGIRLRTAEETEGCEGNEGSAEDPLRLRQIEHQGGI
jgi:hypothetical protein